MEASLEITRLLEQAGAHRIRPSGRNHLVCTCPFHRDQQPSFSINLTNGLWVCYSAKCGVSGNLYNLLVSGVGMGPVAARRRLKRLGSFFLATEEATLQALPAFADRRVADPDQAEVREGHLGLYDFCPKYMLRRGFDRSLLRLWEVGFDYGTDRVTIPVRDQAGRLVGITKRATRDEQEPRYLHLGFWKGSLLYGLHRVVGRSGLFVVEGQTDTMAMEQAAGPLLRERALWPVATLGARVSAEQVGLMARQRRVVLGFDRDADGVAATHRCGDVLVKRMPNDVFVAQLPAKVKDPGMLLTAHPSVVLRYVDSAIPYQQWKVAQLRGQNGEQGNAVSSTGGRGVQERVRLEPSLLPSRRW